MTTLLDATPLTSAFAQHLSKSGQTLPIQQRVVLWLDALVPFLADRTTRKLPTGSIVPVELRRNEGAG